MKLVYAALLSIGLAAPALAGIDEALSDHILPGYAGFAEATEDLAQAARDDCRAESSRSRCCSSIRSSRAILMAATPAGSWQPSPPIWTDRPMPSSPTGPISRKPSARQARRATPST